MSKVVVFGANGRTGRLIVLRALEAGHTVAAAVRRPTVFADLPVPEAHRSRLRVVAADVDAPDGLRAAAAGQEIAVSAIGTGRRPAGLYSRGTAAIVASLEEAGVRRFIAVSSGAVRTDDPHLGFLYGKVISPLFMSELYDDMRAMERVVVASTIDWTLVRPGYLTMAPGRGSWRIEAGGNPRGGWKISRHDLAEFIVTEISERAWVRGYPTLTW